MIVIGTGGGTVEIRAGWKGVVTAVHPLDVHTWQGCWEGIVEMKGRLSR